MSSSVPQGSAPSTPTPSATEGFLILIEAKTTDEVHKRLLKAARSENLTAGIENELQSVITEIIHAN